MTEQRQRVRYQVEFPATFAGEHAEIEVHVHPRNLVAARPSAIVRSRVEPSSQYSSRFLDSPLPSPFRAATVRWTMELQFGIEFLEMQELERARLQQFLGTQVEIVE